MAKMLILAILASCHTALAGCAGSSNATVSEPSCSLYKSGNNVRITIRGGRSQEQCNKLQKDAANSGYWSQVERNASEPLKIICVLKNHKSGLIATVSDTGGAYYGTALCSGLVRSDWVEDAGGASSAVSSSMSVAASSSNAQARREEQERFESEAQQAQRERQRKVDSLRAATTSINVSNQLAEEKKATSTALSIIKNALKSGTGEYCSQFYEAMQSRYSISNSLAVLSGEISRIRSEITSAKELADALRSGANITESSAIADFEKAITQTKLQLATFQKDVSIQISAIDSTLKRVDKSDCGSKDLESIEPPGPANLR